MRFKRLAVAAAALLVAGLAAFAAAVHFLDPRSLAAALAASVKADTGRELSLGAVEVTLLPRPALVLSQLRFGNAAWGSRPWLAQAGRASADIDVLALLSRRLRITRIEVSDGSLFLETDGKGNANWQMGRADAGTPAWLESLQIDGIALRAFDFAYRDGAGGKTTAVRVGTARIDADRARGVIHLSADATHAGNDVEVSGTLGALKALVADAPGYPLEIEGKFGAARVALKGTIDKPRSLGRLQLALSVQMPQFGALRGTAQLGGTAFAPSLSAIDATLGGGALPEVRLRGAVADPRGAKGIDLQLTSSATRWWHFGTARSAPRLPPFRASARVRDAQQGYRVDDLELRIADSAVSASLQVSKAGPRPRITGKAAAPLIDLARLVPESGAATAPASAAAAPRSADYWKLADVELDLSVGRLVLPGGRELRSGSGRVALEDGRLRADALQVSLGGAKATLAGSVADPRHLAGLELAVALQGDELAELLKFFGMSATPIGPYQGRAQLHGSLDAPKLTAIEAQAGRSGQNAKVSGQVGNALTGEGMQLAITANVSDSTAAGRLFGAELPRLPALRGAARAVEAPGGFALEDLKLAMGRSSIQGRLAFARGAERPRLTADLSGPVVDLSEVPRAPPRAGAGNPLLAADIEATVRFDRVVLPERRALGPVSGGLRLAAGAVELRNFGVAVDGASATLEGRIGEPMVPAGLDLVVDAKVTGGAGIAAFTGLKLRQLPPFTASGRLTDVPEGFALADLKLAHAATTVVGTLAVTRGGKGYKVSARGGSALLDVAALMREPGAAGAARPRAAGARAIPDLPLPLEALRAIDADLDLRFDAVKVGEAAPLGPLVLRTMIAGGRLKAEQVLLGIKAGQALNLSGTIDGTQDAWALLIEGKGIDFGELLARLGHTGIVTGGSTDLNVRLQGRGRSLHALLGSLDGDARVTIGPLRVHSFAVDLHSGLVARLLSLAKPHESSEPHTDVKCLAMRLPIAKGVVTSERGVAAETAGYNLVLNGTLNLRSEVLDAALVPVVGGKVRAVVRVGGTLAAPELRLDAASVARSAAGFGAGVATMGAWWLADAVLKRAASDRHPCATALAAAASQR